MLFKSYKERRQHKIRVLKQTDDVKIYGVVLPRQIAEKYSGVCFAVTEDYRGMIVLQSGAKL